MRQTIDVARQWIRTHIGGHPADETLVAYIDRQLEPRRAGEVAKHLASCAACREHLDGLQSGLAQFDHAAAQVTAEFDVEAGLRMVVASLANDAASAAPVRAPQETLNRIQNELTLYVGERAAENLIRSCEEPIRRESLQRAVEPVISAFFGQQTGAAVVDNILRIWDSRPKAA